MTEGGGGQFALFPRPCHCRLQSLDCQLAVLGPLQSATGKIQRSADSGTAVTPGQNTRIWSLTGLERSSDCGQREGERPVQAAMVVSPVSREPSRNPLNSLVQAGKVEATQPRE